MKMQITLLATALVLALPVLAKEVPLNQAATMANAVTPAAASPAFDALESQSLSQLRNALKGDAATLTRDQLEHARQNKTQADTAWLNNARKSHRLFGPPAIPESVLIDWVADWIERGGAILGKSTNFEVRSGDF